MSLNYSPNNGAIWNTPRGRLTRVGGWELGTTLGRGAYAHVRLATHVQTGHKAACKMLPALHGRGTPPTYDHIRDAAEAHKEVVILKALAGCKVPGVVTLEGVMEEDGWTYVFLKLYRGGSLSDYRFSSQGKLKRFFRRLLRVMNTLQKLGISHEDLKRSNILVDEVGSEVYPVVVDFGFAHILPLGHDPLAPPSRVTSTGGTGNYSSPLKYLNKPYDPFANDVWSLGIILCKLLDMPNPWIAEEDDERLYNEPRYDWNSRDLLVGGKADLIEGMLEPDERQRLTIPEILEHPYLYDPKDVPAAEPKLPKNRLSSRVPRPVPMSIVLDICFLASELGEFQFCESTSVIQNRLLDRDPNGGWEQRWATMLSRWEQRAETEWVDLPVVKTPAAVPARLRPQARLKEIHLSPPPKLVLPMAMSVEPVRPKLGPPIRTINRINAMNAGNDENAPLAPASPASPGVHTAKVPSALGRNKRQALLPKVQPRPAELKQIYKSSPGLTTKKIEAESAPKLSGIARSKARMPLAESKTYLTRGALQELQMTGAESLAPPSTTGLRRSPRITS